MNEDPEIEPRPAAGLASELGSFLRHHKRWYLVPLIVVALVLVLLAISKHGAISPYVYPLF